MKIIKKGLVSSLLCGILILSLSVFCFAAGSPKVAAVRSTTDSVYFYMRGDAITKMDVQIGDSLCDVSKADLNIRTLILIDNSISTYETLVLHGQVSKSVKESSVDNPVSIRNAEGELYENDNLTPFITGIINNKAEHESFRIALLSDGVDYLSSWSDDAAVIKDSLKDIKFSDKESHIIRYLYNLISGSGNDGYYQRIILISDGKDDNPNARNFEELSMIEKEKSVPLYVLGVDVGDEFTDEYATLSSYVRIAPSGKFMNTEDGSNINNLHTSLTDDYSLQVFRAVPNRNIFLGSDMGALLNITTASETFSATASVKLPVAAVTPTPVESAETKPTSAPTEETVPSGETSPSGEVTPVPTGNPEEEGSGEEGESSIVGMLIALVVSLLLTGALITLVVVPQVKKLLAKNTKSLAVVTPDDKKPVTGGHKLKKVFKVTDHSNDIKRTLPSTYIMFENLNVSNDIKTFNLTEEKSITVGQDINCHLSLSMDGSVAPHHCTFTLKNGNVYVKDLNTVNKTKIDSVVLKNEEIQLPPTSCVLKVGRQSFKVTVYEE